MDNQTSPIISWIATAEKRIFMDDQPQESLQQVRALRNEPVSFYLAYRSLLEKQSNGFPPNMPISVSVTSETLPLSVYKVCTVPFAASECEDTDDTARGCCPDILIPRVPSPKIVQHYEKNSGYIPFDEEDERSRLNASCASTQSVYITVNQAGTALPSGKHCVQVRVISLLTGDELACHEVTVELINALLPNPEFLYTNWFHYDCLSESHNISVWTDEYFALLGKYLKNAAEHGMNTLLTPAFTPALDTIIGTERMNVQLIGVTKEAPGRYTFDFSLMKRFVDTAKASGIRYFEHCHLFSQWGAKFAINIYGTENGSYKRLFGWETSAWDPEYKAFLQAYLKAFLAFADAEGIGDDLTFHLSDEPSTSHLEAYQNAVDIVKDILKGKRLSDALSHYDFYQHGLLEIPIVHIPRVKDFYGNCKNLMLYYTCGHGNCGMSNRILTSSPWSTRSLGLHLYRYEAKGFLHWAYNFTYGNMSRGLFQPAMEPCFYKNMPAATYLAYPDPIYGVLPSLREKQMCSAINDYRALYLLESLIGRDAVLSLCEGVLGREIDFYAVPESAEQMITLREAINDAIAENL